MTDKTYIVLPVGRLVQGSLYQGSSTNTQGQPLFFKSGPKAGQPRTDYFFAVAIPKGGEQDWRQTPWGATIASIGQTAWPAGQFNNPNFSWKVINGDDSTPDQNGTPWSSKAGFPGHWVVRCSGGYAPTVVKLENGDVKHWTQEGAVNLGDYIQVQISVGSNENTQKPGLYINHHAACFIGYGERIEYKPDLSQVGFGTGPMPAGIMATPPAANGFGATPAPMPQAAAPMPQAAAPMPQAAAPMPQGGMTPPPQPAVLSPTPPAPVAPAAPVKQMTEKAAGLSYDHMVAAGWTDELLVQHGYMVA